MPQNDDGTRSDLLGSQPIARSTSPLATSAALPDDELPPNNPCDAGCLPASRRWGAKRPRNKRVRRPPCRRPWHRRRAAESRRLRRHWSRSLRAWTSRFIIGTPATQALSLMATFLPAGRLALACALDRGLDVRGPVLVFLGAWPITRRARKSYLRHEIRQRIDQVVSVEVRLQQRVVSRGVFVGQRDAETARNLLKLGDGRTLDRHDEIPTSVGSTAATKEPIFQVNYFDSTRNSRPSIRQN